MPEQNQHVKFAAVAAAEEMSAAVEEAATSVGPTTDEGTAFATYKSAVREFRERFAQSLEKAAQALRAKNASD